MSRKPDLAEAYMEMGRILGVDPEDRLFREQPEIDADFREGVFPNDMRASVQVRMEQQKFKDKKSGKWKVRKGKWECVVRTNWPTSNWHAPHSIAWARHCYRVAQLAHRCHYIVASYTWNKAEMLIAIRTIHVLIEERDTGFDRGDARDAGGD